LIVAVGLGCRDESGKPATEEGGAEPEPTALEAPQPSDSGWVRLEPRGDSPKVGLLEEEIDRLQALGYVSGSEAPKEGLVGVTVHVPERSTPGLNLVASGHGHEASLMDASGRVLHTWRKDVEEAFPGRRSRATHFRRTHLFPNGDLLVLYARADGMAKLDRCSNLLWSTANGAHHDFEVQPDGDIYALVRKAHIVPQLHAEKPVLEDFVVVLSPTGEEKRRVSLLAALLGSEFEGLWGRSKPRTGDVFHTNSVYVLGERPDVRVQAFRPGRVLVSILKFNTLALVDLEQVRVVWALKGGFKRQHDAQLLANGHILLFDNEGLGSRSRILELEVATGKTVWEYPADAHPSFHSKTRGRVQRFANGNTLITESDRGRAFEVTADGEVVWEFFNPQRAGREGEFIAVLLDVWRLPPGFPTDWVSEPCPDS
jgi:hypothetical protein